MKKQLSKEVYRYERKFIVPEMDIKEIECLILHHPAMFSEAFYKREINNIYFDSANLKNYHENVGGFSKRIKIRIRWYGELFGKIDKPVLELKMKEGKLGRKKTFVLQPFVLDKNFSFENLQKEIFGNSNLPRWVAELLKMSRPALLNSYTRKYFISANKSFRITLDNNLVFYRIKVHGNNFYEKFEDRERNIVELKYSRENDFTASEITSYFPFRLTASSKYVYGIDFLF